MGEGLRILPAMEGKIRSVISDLVKEKSFGDYNFIDVQPDDTAVGAQFSSCLVFVNLTVEGTNGTEEFHLVLKLPIADPTERVARNCDAMFHNEVTMYREILPALGVDSDLYPKMYYGEATLGSDPDSDLVVLGNLKYKDFSLSKTKLFLDYEHIALAIIKLAEFHSLSYKAKHDNMDRFLELTKKLKEITLPDKNEQEFKAFTTAAVERSIKPLLKKNPRVDVLNKFLNVLKNLYSILKLIMSPVEPFGVICHGDFCNNNVLYRFDKSNKPIDIVFFDFQTSLYTSPVIDLSFYLYMHTTHEFREKYWDDILKLYWDTLRNNLNEQISIPCFEDFLKHFSERAVYGYIISSLFLPAMIMESPVKMEEIASLSLEEKTVCLTSQGGHEGERLISNIVLHLLNKGYIDSFLEFCKK